MDFSSSLKSVKSGFTSYKETLDEYNKKINKYSEVSSLTFIFSANSFYRDSSNIDRGISLESYVLAFYLDAILEKASFRLKEMSEGKYILKRRANEIKGKGQQGLDIDVVDLVTNKERKASTLSGGETFMASLSLALGLSDYVRETVGNRKVDSLFIDEGFGSLDNETLDQVANTLSELTTIQDVSIGIISHVEELKNRISTHLDVKKDRFGHSSVIKNF